MIDSPMTFSRYRRDRLMEIWDESGVPMAEVRAAYPENAMRLEWESMLGRCAERGMPFTRQLLRSLPLQFQHGINRRSKGDSIPFEYVIPVQEKRTCSLCWSYRNGKFVHDPACMACDGTGYVTLTAGNA